MCLDSECSSPSKYSKSQAKVKQPQQLRPVKVAASVIAYKPMTHSIRIALGLNESHFLCQQQRALERVFTYLGIPQGACC